MPLDTGRTRRMPTRTLSGSSSQTSDATDSDSIAEEAASAGTAPSTAGIFELDADSAAGAGTGSESEDSSPAPSGTLREPIALPDEGARGAAPRPAWRMHASPPSGPSGASVAALRSFRGAHQNTPSFSSPLALASTLPDGAEPSGTRGGGGPRSARAPSSASSRASSRGGESFSMPRAGWTGGSTPGSMPPPPPPSTAASRSSSSNSSAEAALRAGRPMRIPAHRRAHSNSAPPEPPMLASPVGGPDGVDPGLVAAIGSADLSMSPRVRDADAMRAWAAPEPSSPVSSAGTGQSPRVASSFSPRNASGPRTWWRGATSREMSRSANSGSGSGSHSSSVRTPTSPRGVGHTPEKGDAAAIVGSAPLPNEGSAPATPATAHRFSEAIRLQRVPRNVALASDLVFAAPQSMSPKQGEPRDSPLPSPLPSSVDAEPPSLPLHTPMQGLGLRLGEPDSGSSGTGASGGKAPLDHPAALFLAGPYMNTANMLRTTSGPGHPGDDMPAGRSARGVAEQRAALDAAVLASSRKYKMDHWHHDQERIEWPDWTSNSGNAHWTSIRWYLAHANDPSLAPLLASKHARASMPELGSVGDMLGEDPEAHFAKRAAPGAADAAPRAPRAPREQDVFGGARRPTGVRPADSRYVSAPQRNAPPVANASGRRPNALGGEDSVSAQHQQFWAEVERAKALCDAELAKITSRIIAHVDEARDPPLTAAQLAPLQTMALVAMQVRGVTPRALALEPHVCRRYITAIQELAPVWEEHAEWPGRSWYVDMLLSVAGLSRVLEWWDAERRFWSFGDELGGSPKRRAPDLALPSGGEAERPSSKAGRPAPPPIETQGLSVAHATPVSRSPAESRSSISSPLRIEVSHSESVPSASSWAPSSGERLSGTSPSGTSPGGTSPGGPPAASPGALPAASPGGEAAPASPAAEPRPSVLMELSLGDERVQYLSSTWDSVFGTERATLLHRPITSVLSPRSAGVFSRAVRQLLEHTSHTVEITFELVPPGADAPVPMEAQGMLMQRHDAQEPSHTMWVLRLLDAEQSQDAAMDELRLSARYAGVLDYDTPLSTELLLCRICERDIPAWFFEKHSEICLEIHRLEMRTAACNEALLGMSETIRGLCARLEHETRHDVPVESEESAPLVYRGVSLCVPPPRTDKPSALESAAEYLGTERTARARALKHAIRYMEEVLTSLDAAMSVSTPAIREEQAALPVEAMQLLSPRSESHVSQLNGWAPPRTRSPALELMGNDARTHIQSKLHLVSRMRNTIVYVETVRVVCEQRVQEMLQVGNETVLWHSDAELSDDGEQYDQVGLHDEQPGTAGEMGLAADGPYGPPALPTDPRESSTVERSVAPAPAGSAEERADRSAAEQEEVDALLSGHDTAPHERAASTAPSAQRPPVIVQNEDRLEEEALADELSGVLLEPREPPEHVEDDASSIEAGSRESPAPQSGSPAPPEGAAAPLAVPGGAAGLPRPARRSPIPIPRHDAPQDAPQTPPMSPQMDTLATSMRRLSMNARSPRLGSSAGPQIVPSASSRATASSIRDFEIIKPISKGAYGSVFLARKRATGDLYAVKVLRKSDMIAKNQITNVRAERMILMNRTQSPFVVKLFFTFQSAENLYLVMEYLPGGDCASLVKVFGGLPEEWARQYLAEIVHGLEYLHSTGVVHRDMKPDNLLIDQHGHLKLTDFGLSKFGLLGRQTHPASASDAGGAPGERSSITWAQAPASPSSSAAPGAQGAKDAASRPVPLASAGDSPHAIFDAESNTSEAFTSSIALGAEAKVKRVVGTPDYLAPESILGVGMDDFGVDWWAVGVILFEMLFGYPPFHADTPSKVFDNILSRSIDWDSPIEVSPEARDLIDRLVCSDRHERLGARGVQEIKQHPFFAGINWDELTAADGPFVPRLPDLESTDYFDARGAVPQSFDDESSEALPQPLVPASSPPHVRRFTRTHSAASTSSANEFGAFSYKNLPVLKQANDEMVRRMRSEHLPRAASFTGSTASPTASLSSFSSASALGAEPGTPTHTAVPARFAQRSSPAQIERRRTHRATDSTSSASLVGTPSSPSGSLWAAPTAPAALPPDSPLVLVADANAVTCTMLQSALAQLRIRTACVANGAEAIHHAMDGPAFTAILLRLALDEVDSQDVARMVKSTRNINAYTPIVALVPTDGDRTLDVSGSVFDAALAVPVTPDAVASLLASLKHPEQ